MSNKSQIDSNLKVVNRNFMNFLFLLNYLMGQPFALSKHSCNLLFVLFIQAKTPNRAVENGVFHYPVGPFVFRVTAAFAISLI